MLENFVYHVKNWRILHHLLQFVLLYNLFLLLVINFCCRYGYVVVDVLFFIVVFFRFFVRVIIRCYYYY